MASSLLVSRLANEISSILIGEAAVQRALLFYLFIFFLLTAQTRRAPRAALGLAGLSGAASSGSATAASAATATVAPEAPTLARLRRSPRSRFRAAARPRLSAQPSQQRLTQPFRPLPVADGLGPPPYFRPPVRLRTGLGAEAGQRLWRRSLAGSTAGASLRTKSCFSFSRFSKWQQRSRVVFLSILNVR